MFYQARAEAIWPDGDAENSRGAVDTRFTDPAGNGETERIRYDFLTNATGPQLRI